MPGKLPPQAPSDRAGWYVAARTASTTTAAASRLPSPARHQRHRLRRRGPDGSAAGGSPFPGWLTPGSVRAIRCLRSAVAGVTVTRGTDSRTVECTSMFQEFLAGGQVDAAVFALRPDYRAMLLAVDGL